MTDIKGPNVAITGDAEGVTKAAAAGDKALAEYAKKAEASLAKVKTAGDKSFDGLMKRVDKMAADIKGSGATARLHEMEMALQKAGGVGSLTGVQFDNLSAKVQRLAAAGGKLPPVFAQMVRGMDEAKAHAAALEKASGGGLGVAVGAQATQGLQGLAGQLGPVGAVMSAMGTGGLVAAAGISAIAGAAVAGAKAVFQLTLDAARYGDAINDLKARTGIAVEDLQRLQYAAGVSGDSFDSVADGVVKLQNALITAPEKFAALGIEVESFSRLRPEEQLAMVAKTLSSIEDPALRNAAAIDLMGKKASELMPFLTSGFADLAAQADAAGAVLDSKTIDALDRTNSKINQVTLAWDALKRGIGAMVGTRPELLGFLDDTSFTLAEIGRRLKEQGVWGTVSGAFKQAAGMAPVETAQSHEKPFVGPPRPSVDDVKQQKIDEDKLRLSLDSKAQAESKAAAAAAKKATEDAAKTRAKDREDFAKGAAERQRDLAQLEAATDKWSQQEQRAHGEAAKSIEDLRNRFKDSSDAMVQTELANAEKEIESIRDRKLERIDYEREVERLTNEGKDRDESRDAQERAHKEKGKKDAEAYAKTFKGTLSSALKDLPQTILGAIQGGGNILSAIGSSIGASIFGADSDLTKSITGGFSKLFGKSIGESLGKVLPGIGALAGPILGKIGGFIGGLFGPSEASKVKKMRDEYIAAAGGLEKLKEHAKGGEAALERLFKASKVKDFEAAVKGVNDALDTQRRAQEAVKEAMERWGLTAKEMGSAFQAKQLQADFASLFQDVEVLRAAGADMTVVYGKMQGSVNEWLNAAVASGTAIPEAMRPTLEEMLKLGLLTDASGAKLESLDNVTWAQTLEQSVLDIVAAVNALVVALGGVPSNVPVNVNVTRTENGPTGPPSNSGHANGFRVGEPIPTHAAGTPLTTAGLAMLHNNEAVLPAYANPWAGGDLASLEFPIPSAGAVGGMAGGGGRSGPSNAEVVAGLKSLEARMREQAARDSDLPFLLALTIKKALK